MKTIDFTKVPIGTRVWDDRREMWGTIVEKLEPAPHRYPIHVVFDNEDHVTYTIDGRSSIMHRPTLWLNEFELVIPEKAYHSPLPDLAVDTPVLVRDHERHEWKQRHFSHFGNERIYTFVNGRTKWSSNDESVVSWKYWKLPDKDDYS